MNRLRSTTIAALGIVAGAALFASPLRAKVRLTIIYPFQRPELYLRKGHITNWDYYPEYVEGDMFGLKTLEGLLAEQPKHQGLLIALAS